MSNGGQNDWQNLNGGGWSQDPGSGYNQPQGYGIPPNPQNQPGYQPYQQPANSGVPVQNYQADPYAPPAGSDLSGGGQTYHGTVPPDVSYGGQPYNQGYNQGYNQPYNQGYNQPYNQGYNQPNQYSVPPVSTQWRRPLVMAAIGIGVVVLIFLLVIRTIFNFGFHSFGYYSYGIPWWAFLLIFAGLALRVVTLFTRASYRSPIATLISVIGIIFTALFLLIIFL